MSRRESRIYAMKVVYQKELGTYGDAGVDELKLEDEIFANTLVEKLEAQKDLLVEKINGSLKDWNFSRLGYLERSILLLAYTEMGGFEEIPLRVSMDEWVEIAKEYCGEEAKKLVNGVLNDFKNNLVEQGRTFE